MRIRIAIILFMAFAQVGFFSKAEAGDEEYHIKILEALKRMNVRLVRIETGKLRSLKSVQESLLNQIMAIRTSIEQIQATGELNKSEMLASVNGVKTKILDVESHLRNEVMAEFNRQKQEEEKFRIAFSALFGQLRNSLATDVENLSKSNQQAFAALNEGNKEQLQKIVKALEEQSQKLVQTQALLKTDLIPALDTQSDETRRVILRDLAQARAVQKNFLESNHKQAVASLATIDGKNKKLIEIFKKSILVDEATKKLTELIQQNIGGANKNIDQTRKMIGILQEVLVQRLKNMTENKAAVEVRLNQDLAEIKNNQRKMTENEAAAEVRLSKDLAEIKNNQKVAQPQLQTLVDVSNKIRQESIQMREGLQASITRRADSNKVQSELSNEKLSRLIDILKTFAVEQGKVDQALQALSTEQDKIDQILQGQGRLDAVLRSQKEVEQLLKGQGLESIASQETILNTQKEITNALKDLRRKANVNISRSDDILKKMKKRK